MISPLNSIEQSVPLNEALGVASRLSDHDKLRLIARLSTQLERDSSLERVCIARTNRSLLGALAHLAPAPSSEDIDEVRQEIHANFPRDELAP